MQYKDLRLLPGFSFLLGYDRVTWKCASCGRRWNLPITNQELTESRLSLRDLMRGEISREPCTCEKESDNEQQ